MPITLLGVPSDAASSFMRGAALAPAKIREVLHNGAANLTTELGVDVGPHLQDVGDVTNLTRAGVRTAVVAALDRGHPLITLGGDHAITYPILQALAPRHPGLSVLQIDAHPDLYDTLDGERYSHASPFARSLEAGLIGRLVQVGIRTLNAHQQEQAERFGVEMIDMRAWEAGERPLLSGPTYLSLDLDGLDPACAPGVSHHEPGGLTTREVIRLIQALDVPLVGADIVELNPLRDPHDRTAAVAAKLLKEIVGRMVGG